MCENHRHIPTQAVRPLAPGRVAAAIAARDPKTELVEGVQTGARRQLFEIGSPAAARSTAPQISQKERGLQTLRGIKQKEATLPTGPYPSTKDRRTAQEERRQFRANAVRQIAASFEVSTPEMRDNRILPADLEQVAQGVRARLKALGVPPLEIEETMPAFLKAPNS